MICLVYFLVFVVLIQHTSAHFELTFPPSKGVAKDTGFIPPCGGYDLASEKRTLLPLETPFVEINSDHGLYNYSVNVIVGNNPSAADYFETSPNFASAANGTRNYSQASCLQFNLSQNISNGTNATIQVTYNSTDGKFYQCADVTFLYSMNDFNKSICTNANGTHPLISSDNDTSTMSSTDMSDATGHLQLASGLVLCVAVLISFFLI
ncbi:hypothetical protein G6F43_006700 [Rhizopus delemar]|nr:hypothetical protein G6F43_006700 [Rhizopus delemar]